MCFLRGEETKEVIEEIGRLTLEDDGLELVSIKNGFFAKGTDRQHKDVRLGVLLRGGVVGEVPCCLSLTLT